MIDLMPLRESYALVLLAGGTGTRFKDKKPKQFFIINGIPVFIKSLVPFLNRLGEELNEVVIVCNPQYEKDIRRAIKRHIGRKDVSIAIVSSGEKRIDSLLNGVHHILEHSPRTTSIIVHDAARPLVHEDDIYALAQATASQQWDVGILAAPIIETLFKVETGDRVRAINRESYYVGQTPYFFKVPVIAHMVRIWRNRTRNFRDSLEVTELIARYRKYHTGYVRAAHNNLKLTYPIDKHIIRLHEGDRIRTSSR